MNKIQQNLSVSAIGAITSILTAIILFAVETKFGFSFYTWTFWFVVPVGAILSGFAAASGYYMGARLFRVRPTIMILMNMVAISIGTFFLINYLSYITLKVDGQLIRESIPFHSFLDFLIRNESLSFRFGGHATGSTGELGSWGYVHALLQILGFAIGGIAVYAHLSSVPYCTRCSIYFVDAGKQTRYDFDPDIISQKVSDLHSLLSAGRPQEAIDKHANFKKDKHEKDYIYSQFQLKSCPKCAMNWLQFTVHKYSQREWKEIENFTYTTFYDGQLMFPEIMSLPK